MSNSNEDFKTVVAIVNTVLNHLDKDRNTLACALVGEGLGLVTGIAIVEIVNKTRPLLAFSTICGPVALGFVGLGTAILVYEKYKEQQCLANFRKNLKFICEQMTYSGFPNQAERLSKHLILVEKGILGFDDFAKDAKDILNEYLRSLDDTCTKVG